MTAQTRAQPQPLPRRPARPTLDVRIMAHPGRRARALALRDRLRALDPVVVWDDQPDGPPSARRTAARAWGGPARGATHRVVLQDDVEVPRDFAVRLGRLLAADPDRPVGLFAAWTSPTGQAVRLAAYLGLAWAPVLGSALSATGVAMPEALAVEYADHLAGSTEERDSLSLYDFLTARGTVPVVAVPNLVEHDRPYLPSIWPEKMVHGPRRSACFVEAEFVEAEFVGPGVEESGEGWRGLDRVRAVPYLSPDTLRSRTWLDGGAEAVPSWRYAKRLGVGTPHLLALFDSGGTSARRLPLSGQVAAAFQYEAWLTGFLTGRALAGLGALGPPRLDSVAARAASRTSVTGCLARILSEAAVARLRDAAGELTVHAIGQGLEPPAPV
jgi:hypothetical protein